MTINGIWGGWGRSAGRVRTFAAAGLMGLGGPALPQAAAADADLRAMGAYIAIEDMQRSVTFYGALFDRAPVIALEDFVAFDIAGGWFALARRSRYAPDAKPGTGAVPYIQSGDLEALADRVATATGGEVPLILDEPVIRVMKIRDPDGHLVEFFTLMGP